ncbi:MAG: AAC(3) family N-acetyltransferase [Anaerolineae bacterium]|nr:AAC(3) family N-acetyltransferase [Anaerolineae bacterium]
MTSTNIPFLTTEDLIDGFRQAGLFAGQTVIVHTSMKAFGCYLIGGEQAVVDALMAALTPQGTLVMPTHSADNSDPSTWRKPPLPPEQWDLIRQHMPPYRPESTPTNRMGRINECFRSYPGVLRSAHPAFSLAAWGQHAAFVSANQALDNSVAEQSPIGRIYDLDGWVCLMGVGHDHNTSLHLADYRARWLGKMPEYNGSAMWVDGKRQWVTYYDESVVAEDFEMLGSDFEAETDAVKITMVGAAVLRVMRQRVLVDYAVRWMEAHRPASLRRSQA